MSIAETLRDGLLSVRDRLLSNPDLQRIAASTPLLRWAVRRETRALFDLCAGFIYSQILAACVEFDLFARVADEPRSVAELAAAIDLPEEATDRLVRAAISLRLLSRRSGGRIGLGLLGVAMHTDPGIAAMVRHHALLYRDLADPVALLRGGRGPTELSRYWAYARAATPGELAPAEVGQYSTLMATSQSFIARDVLDAYPFERHRCLLDVGGGEGAFAVAAASRHPSLQVKLFDLPAVAARARDRVAAAGLGARVTTHGGSFRSDPLPRGADIATLVRVLHDHDDAVAAGLLRAIHAALPPGGTLLITEPMSGVRGAEPIGDAYFGLYLFAMGSGRPRTQAEIRALLTHAGFKEIRTWPTRRPILTGMLSALRS